jgi:hypothetical protein
MGGVCSTNGREEERVYVIDEKAREKEILGRPKHKIELPERKEEKNAALTTMKGKKHV